MSRAPVYELCNISFSGYLMASSRRVVPENMIMQEIKLVIIRSRRKLSRLD